MKSNLIAALAAAGLLAAAGAVGAQTSGTAPAAPGQSGGAAGTSTPGPVGEEIRTQLLAMGYTDVGPVTESAPGLYETQATRDGEQLTLEIDLINQQIRESKN